MADPKSVLVAKAIQAALEDITTANGYFTNLGKSVHRGFYAHAIKGAEGRFPLAAIHPGTEVENARNGNSAKVQTTLNIYLVDSEDSTDSLQACLSDVRRALALHSKSIEALTVNNSLAYQAAEYNPQPDSNYQLAALPVSLSFVEKYEE